jgi:hypothetical protein
VNNISKEHLEVFRQYLLAHKEDVKHSLLNSLPDLLLKQLLIIEDGFLNNDSIEKIALTIDAQNLVSTLKQLQIEYYNSLVQLYFEGKTNKEIEHLLSSDNLTFRNIISDENKFERDLSYAIRLTERDAFKKKFLSIDEADEFQLSEKEIKSAISQLERKSLKLKFVEIDKIMEVDSIPASDASTGKVLAFNLKPFIKYAAAAVILGFIFIGGYHLMNVKTSRNYELAEKVNTKENKLQSLDFKIPLIDEQRIQKNLLQPQSLGFIEPAKISITIIIKNIGRQINRLEEIRSILYNRKDRLEYTTLSKQISIQIDSLIAIRNTYLYIPENKNVILSILTGYNVVHIINLNPSQNRTLYLKLNNNYYKLKATGKHEKLIPIEDKTLLEELNKIIFQNQ